MGWRVRVLCVASYEYCRLRLIILISSDTPLCIHAQPLAQLRWLNTPCFALDRRKGLLSTLVSSQPWCSSSQVGEGGNQKYPCH